MLRRLIAAGAVLATTPATAADTPQAWNATVTQTCS
ncbi:hypothetical protein SNARM312S_07367 [Streptomyces narbonensis]